jgi:MATE family multidrug resistance protein
LARLAEWRAILRISGPLAAAYLAEIAMGITDMLFVGRLGSVELAAVGLASGVLFEILIVAVGLAVGTSLRCWRPPARIRR